MYSQRSLESETLLSQTLATRAIQAKSKGWIKPLHFLFLLSFRYILLEYYLLKQIHHD